MIHFWWLEQRVLVSCCYNMLDLYDFSKIRWDYCQLWTIWDKCFVLIVKEIHLKHRAPVVSICVVDHGAIPFLVPSEVQPKTQPTPEPDLSSGSHSVIICSEEQLKVNLAYMYERVWQFWKGLTLTNYLIMY